MLVPVFGTSSFAVGVVLAAFMAGLALGGAWAGRIADRRSDPLRVYAVVEALLGGAALLFPLVLARLDVLYTLLYRQLEGSPFAFGVARTALAFLLLLPPTTLIGATLPALAKWAVERPSRVGRGVGTLYALNTLGAACGCCIAAFVLIELAGVRATTWIAAAGNLLVAATAWIVARRAPAPFGRSAPSREHGSRAATDVGVRAARVVFWGFAASGFAALGYEIVWTRLMSVIAGITTTQSLSTVLIVFLVGLAAGGAVGARIADRTRDPFAVFGTVELAIGALGIASILAFHIVPEILESRMLPPSWIGHIGKLGIASAAVIGAPTFLLGLLFPIAARMRVTEIGSLGQRLGGIYAANTAGAIAGALTTSFVLLPALGSQRSLLLLGGVHLAVGVTALTLHDATPWVRRALPILVLGVPALVMALVIPPTSLPELFTAKSRGKLIDWSEDAGGVVTVVEFPDGRRLLRVNGAGEVPTDHASIQTFRLLGSLPLLLHGGGEDVLVIAFGGGVTLSAVELLQPRRIDCVELVGGVVEAAPDFAAFNNRVYERLGTERLRLIAEDGRNHVLRTARQYDVIISDSTHPATADSWVLYTREFYELCRKRLAPGGVLAQWLPMHGLTDADHAMILRTFSAVFPHATLWLTAEYGVLLATPEPLRVDLDAIERRIATSGARPSLAEVDLGDALSLVSTLALDERAFRSYGGGGPINTDDRPLIGFRDRTRAGTGGGIQALLAMLPHMATSSGPPLTSTDASASTRLERRRRARLHAFTATIALAYNDRARAELELRRSSEADPSDPFARRLRERLRNPP